ncbi:MAG TPA: rhomboid family intramembrane serine protease [Saprospirales bacterium]|nr:rhomboid family intramembrane serine protease [Saprospirales bacterium]HAY72229.1 rhomboid family intramembrane serine protease [Saprospirales bacterium]HRQ28894.1 rhomboid family intramembrane serine protease [Saprospiraceae bacterium]
MITTIIFAVVFITSIAAFSKDDLFSKMLFSPYLTIRKKQWYRLLSAGFVHGSWVHLLINLFVFWQFGTYLESYFGAVYGFWGSKLFMAGLFFGGIVFANCPSLYIHAKDYNYQSIGASGGVSAVLFAYILINPWDKLLLYFVIPLYSVIAGVLFLIYSYWASKNRNDHIDHLAHFSGSVFGVVYTMIAYPGVLPGFLDKFLHEMPF